MNSLNNNEHSWIIQTFGIILFRDKFFNNFVFDNPSYNPIIGSTLEIAKLYPEKYNDIVNKLFANSLIQLSK